MPDSIQALHTRHAKPTRVEPRVGRLELVTVLSPHTYAAGSTTDPETVVGLCGNERLDRALNRITRAGGETVPVQA